MYQKEESTLERIEFADFRRKFKNLWGYGLLVAMDAHARKRANARMETGGFLLSFDSISDLVKDILNRPGIEDALYDIPWDGSRICILDEVSGITVMMSIAFSSNLNLLCVFVHSVYIFDREFADTIFLEPRCKTRIKVCSNGSVQFNPPEMKTRNLKKSPYKGYEEIEKEIIQ